MLQELDLSDEQLSNHGQWLFRSKASLFYAPFQSPPCNASSYEDSAGDPDGELKLYDRDQQIRFQHVYLQVQQAKHDQIESSLCGVDTRTLIPPNSKPNMGYMVCWNEAMVQYVH